MSPRKQKGAHAPSPPSFRYEVYGMFISSPPNAKTTTIDIAGPRRCQTKQHTVVCVAGLLKHTHPFRVLIVDTAQRPYEGGKPEHEIPCPTGLCPICHEKLEVIYEPTDSGEGRLRCARCNADVTDHLFDIQPPPQEVKAE